MNSIRDMKLPPELHFLIDEARRNIIDRACMDGASQVAHEQRSKQPLDSGITNRCAVCLRGFKASAEYVTCRLCNAHVCRRKVQCMSLHRADHHVVMRKAQTLEGS